MKYSNSCDLPHKVGYVTRWMLALLIATMPIAAWSQGRVARIAQGIYLYSNWDAPYVTLDTCLDMSITEARIPVAIEHGGRSWPVIEIGPGAFRGCHNLTTVFFNDNGCPILRDAFRDCPNLRVLVSPCRVPPTLESKHPFYGGKFDDIFEPYHARTVIVVVPPGCEQAYRAAPGWRNFEHIQSALPTDTQLSQGERKRRAAVLQTQLERARATVQRLEQELDRLRRQ